MQTIPIIANGNLPLQRVILSNGFQAFAVGTWGGAKITIQVSPNSTSGWLTIKELTADDAILPNYPLLQGLYMQITVSNATETTNLAFCSGPLFVMQF